MRVGEKLHGDSTNIKAYNELKGSVSVTFANVKQLVDCLAFEEVVSTLSGGVPFATLCQI